LKRGVSVKERAVGITMCRHILWAVPYGNIMFMEVKEAGFFMQFKIDSFKQFPLYRNHQSN
jgi:hypothetical protein